MCGALAFCNGVGMDPQSVGGRGGELFGMKKLTTIHSWKILIRAFVILPRVRNTAKLEDPVPDPTLHFPACNLLAFTVGFRSV